MHSAHPAPSNWHRAVDHDTVVCRCEDVTYGQITSAQERFRTEDPRTLKGVTRAGMGMCQGRICGAAMTCLAATDDRPTASRATSKRPFAIPTTLGALAEDQAPSE